MKLWRFIKFVFEAFVFNARFKTRARGVISALQSPNHRGFRGEAALMKRGSNCAERMKNWLSNMHCGTGTSGMSSILDISDVSGRERT